MDNVHKAPWAIKKDTSQPYWIGIVDCNGWLVMEMIYPDHKGAEKYPKKEAIYRRIVKAINQQEQSR